MGKRSMNALELRSHFYDTEDAALCTEIYGSSQDCTICLSPVDGSCGPGQVLPCGHIYHKECIRGWLRRCGPRYCPMGRCWIPQSIIMAAQAHPDMDFTLAEEGAWETLPTDVIAEDIVTSV